MEKNSQNIRLTYRVSLKNKLKAYDIWKTSSSLNLPGCSLLTKGILWRPELHKQSVYLHFTWKITRRITILDRVKRTVWVEEINQAFPTEGAGTSQGWLEEWQSRSEEKVQRPTSDPKPRVRNSEPNKTRTTESNWHCNLQSRPTRYTAQNTWD